MTRQCWRLRVGAGWAHNEWMRWRRVAVVAGIVLVAGVGGVAGSGLFIYHEATKIDRSEPEVVTDEYLRAALVRKDKVGADLYACSDQSKLAPIKALRDDLDKREKDFGVSFLVTWGSYRRTGSALTADLTLSGRRDGVVDSKWTESWRFEVVNEGGWRVCGAEKIAQPSASPSVTPTTAP